MLSFKDVPKTVQQLSTLSNVFADIYENNSPLVLKLKGKIITKGCNSFTGEYGTQHSFGMVLDVPNDLQFLFSPTDSLKREIKGWKRKPIFKGNDETVLFLKVKEPIALDQNQKVVVACNVGIHFCPATKTIGVYFKNLIVD